MYKTFPITPPISTSTITAYKSLRLTSLQVDPSSFSSNYAREAAFTDEEWYGRISSSVNAKQTFVASTVACATNRDGDETQVKETWVGTVTILGPSELLPSTLAPLEKACIDANWSPYFLVAMWVDPDHRGRGVGHELVMQGLEWVRGHRDATWTVGKEKVVMLLVHNDNARGRALYAKAGFEDIVQMPVDNGERWMFRRL